MTISEMAAQKLRVVQAAITAEPKMYNQSRYVNLNNPCDSACCIAGWLIWNDSPEKFAEMAEQNRKYIMCESYTDPDWQLRAEKILGNINTGSLFSGNPKRYWPEQFASRWKEEEGDSAKGRAAIAFDRIDYFIETGE